MARPDAMTLTFFLVVGDQDRSRDWYRDVLGARVTRERDPVVLDLAGATVILDDGGPPTPDRVSIDGRAAPTLSRPVPQGGPAPAGSRPCQG